MTQKGRRSHLFQEQDKSEEQLVEHKLLVTAILLSFTSTVIIAAISLSLALTLRED